MQSEYILSSLHFEQQGRQLYQQHRGLFAFDPCCGVRAPDLGCKEKRPSPANTGVRRVGAHHLTELINRKPRCSVFSSLGFKKNVFQILLCAIRSFPLCQSLLQCLDGSHEFAGRLCSKPPLLPPINRPLLEEEQQVVSVLPVWQPLWGGRQVGTVPPARPMPWQAALSPPTPLPLLRPRSPRTSLPPCPCPWHKNRAPGVNLTKITMCLRGILLPFRIPHPQSIAVNLPLARSLCHPLLPACFLWKGRCSCGC